MKIVLYFIREVEGVAIRFDFAIGLFCVVLGALMLWRAPALTDVLSVMIGLLVLVDSVFKLQVAVDSRRMGAHSWWVTLVCTVVCLVLGVLLAIIIKTFATGAHSEDMLGSFICAGIGGAFMAQIFVNVGMNLRLLPVIGVTLPFYSAGGSSVLMLYICVGLVLSVYMHNTKKLFG